MTKEVTLSVLIGMFTATATARAATVVVNVNSVSQLYSAFSSADSNPNNVHEIHLAPGTYHLFCSAQTTDNLATSGSLKLNKGNVVLIGSNNDQSMAANYVIDGGWDGNNRCTSILKMRPPGALPTVPTIEFRGVYLQNGKARPGGVSALDVRNSRLLLNYSRVFHSSADATGGAAIGTLFSTVTIYRSMIDGASMEDYPDGCGTGLFSWGGALYLDSSSATVTESTIIGGNSCRGGGVAFKSSASTDLLAITNSTISFNAAVVSGGGLYAAGPGKVSLISNTISDNTAALGTVVPGQMVARFGGGLALNGLTGKLTMNGNALARNNVINAQNADGTPINDAYDCYIQNPAPSTITASFNLIGRQGNCTFAPLGRLVGRVNSRVDPRLGVFDIVWMVWPGLLGMYNGLLPGSVAFGANAGNCPIGDQRGTLRPGSGCDIGAYQTACAHDPCVTGRSLTAACGDCVESICFNDPHCCSSTWDSSCVNQIASVCSISCQ